MYDAVDHTYVDQQPKYEESVIYYIYFVAFIGTFIFKLFSINQQNLQGNFL